MSTAQQQWDDLTEAERGAVEEAVTKAEAALVRWHNAPWADRDDRVKALSRLTALSVARALLGMKPANPWGI
jgi:hypothetical protein